jgi:4-alpha-glucanotransferase
MNFPGKGEGNWTWRYRTELLTSELGDRLKLLTQRFGRAPVPHY